MKLGTLVLIDGQFTGNILLKRSDSNGNASYYIKLTDPNNSYDGFWTARDYELEEM